jgi:hypothetical protein
MLIARKALREVLIDAVPPHVNMQWMTTCTGVVPPGGAQSDGTPKIINPLITHNTTQFKKSKSTENIIAFSSTLSSTFYVS